MFKYAGVKAVLSRLILLNCASVGARGKESTYVVLLRYETRVRATKASRLCVVLTNKVDYDGVGLPFQYLHGFGARKEKRRCTC